MRYPLQLHASSSLGTCCLSCCSTPLRFQHVPTVAVHTTPQGICSLRPPGNPLLQALPEQQVTGRAGHQRNGEWLARRGVQGNAGGRAGRGARHLRLRVQQRAVSHCVSVYAEAWRLPVPWAGLFNRALPVGPLALRSPLADHGVMRKALRPLIPLLALPPSP